MPNCMFYLSPIHQYPSGRRAEENLGVSEILKIDALILQVSKENLQHCRFEHGIWSKVMCSLICTLFWMPFSFKRMMKLFEFLHCLNFVSLFSSASKWGWHQNGYVSCLNMLMGCGENGMNNSYCACSWLCKHSVVSVFIVYQNVFMHFCAIRGYLFLRS